MESTTAAGKWKGYHWKREIREIPNSLYKFYPRSVNPQIKYARGMLVQNLVKSKNWTEIWVDAHSKCDS